VICELPYAFLNSTNGCASTADRLGDAFTAYNLALISAAALNLFGFLRSCLLNLRKHDWHFVGRASVLIPMLCTMAQLLALVEATNLHLLRWTTRIWASLGCDLFFPCAFSALLVYYDDTRHRDGKLGGLRRLYNVLLHTAPWSLGLASSVINATRPTSAAQGVSYVYIVPFVLVLAADMARVVWIMRAAQDHRDVRRTFIGLCALLVLMAAYLIARGVPLLVADRGQTPRQMPPAFPFESMPIPIAKVFGSTMALFQYGGRRRSDTPASKKSLHLDPLPLVAAHVAALAGLISTGFVVATAEAVEAVFFTTVAVVPTLFVAALCAQLLRAGPLLERSDDDTAALIAQCKADLSATWSIPIGVKQFFTGSFLVSLSVKMGPAHHGDGGSSGAFRALTMLVELEGLLEWAQGHRFDLSIVVLATYVVVFGTFLLLRLAPMPPWFLAATFAAWASFYDLFLISAMRFGMKGLKCDGGHLVLSESVPCDLSYAHREALWAGFAVYAPTQPYTRAHGPMRLHVYLICVRIRNAATYPAGLRALKPTLATSAPGLCSLT
jgi:hypothetical protein